MTPPLNTTFSLKVQRAINRGAQTASANQTIFKLPPETWTPPIAPPLPQPGYCKCPPTKQPPKPRLVKDLRPYYWRNDGGAFDPPIADDETMKGWGWGNISTSISGVLPQIVNSVPGVKQPTTLDKFLITGSSIGSQIIAAFGRNPTQQVSYPGAQIIPMQQYGQQQPVYQQQPTLTPQQMQAYYAANTPGAGVGQGIDGVFNWIQQNPMIVLAFGVGAYLLFRQPPGRR